MKRKRLTNTKHSAIIVFGNRGVRKIKKMPIRKDKIILTDIDGCVLDWGGRFVAGWNIAGHAKSRWISNLNTA